MEKTEPPKPWKERKAGIRHRWAKPFIYAEWCSEKLSYRLSRWAFLDILNHLGRLSILVGIIFYVGECGGRRQAKEDQRKVKHYQAWQVIHAARGSKVGGGRIDALQTLCRDKFPLIGIELPGANLSGINLSRAYLFEANLSGAVLSQADLSGAHLIEANLSGAALLMANLSGANLELADLRKATLRGNIGRTAISNVHNANIFGIDAPKSFVKWAKENGAVCFENDDEWDSFIKKQNSTDKSGQISEQNPENSNRNKESEVKE